MSSSNDRGDEEIILFHYEQSIFSHRLLWYLRLRGLKYSECIQPPYLPRPNLKEGLGISYRRIPILAIGRDVYCDTQIILQMLEERYPEGRLGPTIPAEKGIQKLFQNFSIHGGVFWRAASLLPTWRAPFLQDPKFIEDRSELTGTTFDTESLEKGRPDSLVHIRQVFDMIEHTFLADGRKWILGGDDDKGPSLADIDAIFPLQWLFRDPLMEESVPEEIVSASKYPRTFAWIDRFLSKVKEAQDEAPEVTTLTGSEAISKILGSQPKAFDTRLDNGEPLNLTIGNAVSVHASDHGAAHVDHGVLISLTTNEVTILNKKRIHLHFPRWNFTMMPQEDQKSQTKPSAIGSNGSSQGKDMRLIYHPMSPYSRKVYMLAHELNLTSRIKLDKVVVAPVEFAGWSDDNAKVAEWNPIGKIPTLITNIDETQDEDNDGIYDSRIIAEYLLAEAEEASSTKPSTPSDKPTLWRLRILQACADGILDAQVLLIYEHNIRAEKGLKFDAWIEGQNAKIDRGLDKLDKEAKRGTLRVLEKWLKKEDDDKEYDDKDRDEVAHPTDVTVAAMLGFLNIINREWRNGRAKLAEWFEEGWEGRESFRRTRPDVDWETGEVVDLGFASEVVEKVRQ